MLIIRREQLAALGADAVRGYAPKIAAYLREAVPELAGQREDLLGFVREAMQRGQGYEFETEWDLARFAKYELLLGPEFDTQCGWAHKRLTRTDRTPTERINLVEAYYTSYFKSK